MDKDIEKWKNKPKAANYCSSCGGSGKLRGNITGCPSLDFSTCQYCKGIGQPVNNKFKAGPYTRALQPWIEEFERIFSYEENDQQQKETGSRKAEQLAALPGEFPKPRQGDIGTQRNKKPQIGGYAIPCAGGENNPVLCHPREVR
jgi:hypothetical protein